MWQGQGLSAECGVLACLQVNCVDAGRGALGLQQVPGAAAAASASAVVVQATVDESADLWASNGKQGDSYRTQYQVLAFARVWWGGECPGRGSREGEGHSCACSYASQSIPPLPPWHLPARLPLLVSCLHPTPLPRPPQVEYTMVAGADGAWRITSALVLGRQ